MTEKNFASWTYRRTQFSIVESVMNFCLASGAPDTRVLTFRGFRTYRGSNKIVYIEVTDESRREQAIKWAQKIYTHQPKDRNHFKRRSRGLVFEEENEYMLYPYGHDSEYRCDYQYSRTWGIDSLDADDNAYYQLRVFDMGRSYVNNSSITDLDDEGGMAI